MDDGRVIQCLWVTFCNPQNMWLAMSLDLKVLYEAPRFSKVLQCLLWRLSVRVLGGCPPLSLLLNRLFSFYLCYMLSKLPWWLSGKGSACQCRRRWLDSWVGKIPLEKKWQSTPVLLPGKSHGQRNLAGYRPWGYKRVRHDLATKQQHVLSSVSFEKMIN